MIKLPRQNRNHKSCCWFGAGIGVPWFCRGEIAIILQYDQITEAKRYRPRYPLPTTIILYRYNNFSTTTISLSGTARYHPACRHTSARAASPIHGGGYVWPAYDERQHPIPDFPPYDVRPPHMHGAPTTDDTSHGDTDAKQRTRRALIMCLQQLPETMLRKEKS